MKKKFSLNIGRGLSESEKRTIGKIVRPTTEKNHGVERFPDDSDHLVLEEDRKTGCLTRLARRLRPW